MPSDSPESVVLTSGLFQVAQLPAAQVVSVRIYLTNVENANRRAHVQAHKLVLGQKQEILSEEVEIPGDGQHILELGGELVEGEVIEVTVSLPTNGFVASQSGIVPGVAVVTFFVGDETTSLLQWISGGDFVGASRPM